MIVKAEENETYDDRKATVTITDTKDPTKMRTFTVTQAQKDGLIVDVYEPFIVPTDGGQVSFDVMSNIGYIVYIPREYADWLSQASNTRGLETKTVTINVAKNTSQKNRVGYVGIVNSKDNNEVTWVEIDQKFDIVFSVDPQSITVDELRNEISFNVNANIPVDVNTYPDWVQKGTIEEVDDDNYIYKMTVTPFTEKKLSRQGTIVFENAAYFKEVAVTVIQNRLLYIEESEIEVPIGGRFGLTLRNDTEQEAVWKSDNEKVATITKDGTVIGVADGMTTISVTSADGKYTDKVTVQVKQANAAKLNDAWSKVLENGIVTSFTITLTNNDDRTIHLKPGSLYRVTVDGDETTTEKIGEDSVTKDLKSGESHTASFSSVAPATVSETATYSYYMVWDYNVDLQDFTYTATEK
jgi:archaellum component FlaG (FlaF/FlaG flagellin family)